MKYWFISPALLPFTPSLFPPHTHSISHFAFIASREGILGRKIWGWEEKTILGLEFQRIHATQENEKDWGADNLLGRISVELKQIFRPPRTDKRFFLPVGLGLRVVRREVMRIQMWLPDTGTLHPDCLYPLPCNPWGGGEVTVTLINCMMWGGEWSCLSCPGWSPDKRLSQDYMCERPETNLPHSPVPSTALVRAHEGCTEVMQGLSPPHGASNGPVCHRRSLVRIDGGQPRWVLHGLTTEDQKGMRTSHERPACTEGSLENWGLR